MTKEIIINIILFTCTFVFVATSIIALLGFIGKIKIKPEYLNKLFYLLIVEIVVIGVGVFKDTLWHIESVD